MRALFDRFRNPEHTGRYRCWPCTIANAALLLFACAALVRRRSRMLAGIVGAAGTAAIALRGYLVPYTPEFAPRLVAALPGDPFHDAPSRPESAGAPDRPDTIAPETDPDGEEILAGLVERDVLVPDGETLYLDPEVRERWREESTELRANSDRELAAALGAAAPEGTVVNAVEPDEDRWFVVSDGSGDPSRERWLTRPVALAETAAVRALADRTDLDPIERARAAGALRTFLEACPACGGPVEETTAVACCGGPSSARADAPRAVLACGDCGARLYTFQ